MGFDALSELQLRNREVNGRPHTNFLFPHHPPNGTLGLAALENDTVDWFKTTGLSI